MCDETESSEPLRGLGSKGVGGGGRKGCWDTSHYNINKHGVQGLECPGTGGYKAQEDQGGKEEKETRQQGEMRKETSVRGGGR